MTAIGQEPHETHAGSADPADALLLVLADALDDIETIRKATANRLRSLTTVKGLDSFTNAAVSLQAQLDAVEALEKQRIRELEAAMAAHRLGPWVERTKGLGLKAMARLLATIGDPLWNGHEGRPRRGPDELRAYCGYSVEGGQRPRRQKGVKANWNSRAKSRAFVAANAALRQGHYAPLYQRAKAAAAAKVHDRQCQNTVYSSPNAAQRTANGCGTRAHPEWGEPGSPWRPGHQHQHAISIVAKEILKDMFLEAKRLSHDPRELQPVSAQNGQPSDLPRKARNPQRVRRVAGPKSKRKAA